MKNRKMIIFLTLLLIAQIGLFLSFVNKELQKKDQRQIALIDRDIRIAEKFVLIAEKQMTLINWINIENKNGGMKIDEEAISEISFSISESKDMEENFKEYLVRTRGNFFSRILKEIDNRTNFEFQYDVFMKRQHNLGIIIQEMTKHPISIEKKKKISDLVNFFKRTHINLGELEKMIEEIPDLGKNT